MWQRFWRRIWSPPLKRQRRWNRAIVVVLPLLLAAGVAALAINWNVLVTAATFADARGDQTALRTFLAHMPKGADLHVHLSGAVYAEDLIAWGKDKNLCFDIPTLSMSDKSCGTETAPNIADAFDPAKRGSQTFYDRMVNAMSMRSFVPSAQIPSGHDQFFATFGRFGAVTWQVPAEMTAAILRHDAADAVQYTELMVTLLPDDYGPKLLAAIADVTDSQARLKRLKDGNLDQAVAAATKTIDGWVKQIDDILACDPPRTQPGCNVSYKYIAQINRNANEASVFVQTAFAAALVRADRRVVGLNFVGPEDYRVARTDYRRHMDMIGFLAKDVPVALHAGELWLGLVPPEDLTFHIRQAVEVAGARRIGHGIALAFEHGRDELLTEMRQHLPLPVAIEINLTSNDVILGVRGKDHPLMAYWAAGVPVTLSTDDMGVSRIDLSNEYVRAARDYPLGYRALKKIARNSLDYSFLGGAEKDEQIRRLESSFIEFERATAARTSTLDGLLSIVKAGIGWR